VAPQHLKEAYSKDKDKILAGPVVTGQGVMALNQRRIDLDWI